MNCPRCSKLLVIEDTTLNGEPITVFKCENCNYMRIKGE